MIENNLYKTIEELETIYPFLNVKIEIKKELPDIQYDSDKFQDYKIGDKLEIPLWIAEELEEMNYCHIDTEEFKQYLFKTLNTEKIQEYNKLSKINNDIYKKIRFYLYLLGLNPNKKEELENIRNSFRKLINIRTGKIMSFANSPDIKTTLEQNIAEEEYNFLKMMNNLTKKWKSVILGE